MSPNSALPEAFVAALDHRSRVEAVELVTAARGSGTPLRDIVDGVLVPAQREVGLRWERDEWDVAREHAATMICDVALSAIATEPHQPPKGRLVAACPAGEWHALAVRLIAEALRELDWDVTFLGASVPAGQLRRFLTDHRPDALLLGSSMAGRLPAAADCVRAAGQAGVPTVLGGAVGRAYPDSAAAIGAHPDGGDGGDGTDVHAVDRLLDRITGPAAGPVARPAPRARYDELTAGREELVAEVVRYLRRSRFASLEPDLWELLCGTVGELVDTLAASLLLDDGAPLRDLVGWTHRVTQARQVDAGVVDELMHDLHLAVVRHAPQAQVMLEVAVDDPTA